VLPRYISVDKEGNEHEFLLDYYKSPAQALDMVFLKGYQWPFDTSKIEGSSRIDLLVAAEMKEKGRTVYMDFRKNPSGLLFDQLSKETHTYLQKSDALFGTPIERLAKMNPKAIELYRNNGIDLYTQPLKIAVCAQHCNGGIAVDTNWESSIKGLFVAGEAAGTFGVYRPGGSALNSAQVGAMRAAEGVARKDKSKTLGRCPKPHKLFEKSLTKNFDEDAQCASWSNDIYGFSPPKISYSTKSNAYDNLRLRQEAMSHYAAYRRDTAEMRKLYDDLCRRRDSFFQENSIANDSELPHLYKSYDLLITQIAMLSAMIFSADKWGTHGGALVEDATQSAVYQANQVVITADGKSKFEPVRPLPECDDWFERIWNEGE